MIKTQPINLASKIMEAVDSSVHQPHIDVLLGQTETDFNNACEDIEQFDDINNVLENLKVPTNASHCISYLIKLEKTDLEELLNQRSEIIPIIVSYISSGVPDLIVSSLEFLDKCCSIENFPEFLLEFLSLNFLTESAFSSDCKQIIIHICQLISNIVFSIGEVAEENVLFFFNLANQTENDLLISASFNILYAYLRKVKQLNQFFQDINLIVRLNENLLMLKYPKQLMISLKIIKFCLNKMKISYLEFNINQIIKLIKSNIASIQELSIVIIKDILLYNTSENFNFVGKLCKSLNWVFHNGSIKLKLKALFCMHTLFNLCSDEYPGLVELLDDNFFDTILCLLSSGNNGSIEAMSFLIYLVQDDFHPECKHQVIETLLDFEIHEQLESLAASDEKMISFQSATLLNLVERYCDDES